MEKILLISLYEPCKYGGHTGGPVILIHNILEVIDRSIQLDLIVFKKTALESELPENVRFISWDKLGKKIKNDWYLKVFKRILCRDCPCYSLNVAGYSKIIFYPYFSALFKLENNQAKCYTIGMDSGPMLYLRGFLNQKKIVYKAYCLSCFFQALFIDKKATSRSEKVFTVGEADAEFYRSAYLADASFVHHPISDLINGYQIREWRKGEKLELCFPGGMTRFYVAELLDEILQQFINNAEQFKNTISISFLGKIKYKKLEQELRQLTNLGIEVNCVEFADSFEEYLSQQHLILLPLAVGAGTKNKSLSTLGMGLDIIGTPIALENIYGATDSHIARTAGEFINLINLRLQSHNLYGLSQEELFKFKENHSLSNWHDYFWNEVLKG